MRIGTTLPAVTVGLALLLRVLTFASAHSTKPEYPMAPDSFEYDRLARTLLADGRFDDPTPGVQTSRTPGYPILLAGIYKLAGPFPVAVVVVQIVLSAGTVLMVHLLARQLWSPATGLIAGLLLACDAPSISAGHRLLTETLFTFLLVAAVMAVLYRSNSESPPSRGSLVLFGSLLALSALTRPIGILLFGPAVLWIVWRGRSTNSPPGGTIRAIGYALLPWVGLVGGWQIRNGLATERVEVSYGPAKFLLLGRGADIVAQRDGISAPEARARILQTLREAEINSRVSMKDLYASEAWALIRAHPALFLKTQWRWLPELMLGTGAAGLIEALRPAHPLVTLALFTFCALHLLAVYAGALTSLLLAARSGPSSQTAALALLALLLVYFVVLSTGPQTYSRFRVPMMPLLIVCAAGGFHFASIRLSRSKGILGQARM